MGENVSDDGEKRAPAVWRKRGKPSKEAIQRRRERGKAARIKAATRISPVQARWLGELARTGGNQSAAARSVGVNPQTARRWLALQPVKEAFDQILQGVEQEVRDWASVLGRAQATLVDLLDSEDDRVRMSTAQYLVDRQLGKVSQKIDATVVTRNSLGEVELEAALSLVAMRGMSLAEATAYVRAHPQEVEAWAAQQLKGVREPLAAAISEEEGEADGEVGEGAVGLVEPSPRLAHEGKALPPAEG